MLEANKSATSSFVIYVLLLVMSCQSTLAQEVVFGTQLNDGAFGSFGSGMAYDARTHRLYITGGTYGLQNEAREAGEHFSAQSNCFFGVLQLPRQVFMSPQWIRRVQVGLDGISEACSDLYVSRANGDIYLLGHSVHSASVLSPLIPAFQSFYEPSISGLLMHFNRGADLVGGALIRSNAVQYPIAVQGDKDSSHLFVASIKTNTMEPNPIAVDFENRENTTQADTTTMGYVPPEYGSDYSILLQSFRKQVSKRNEDTGMGLQETLKMVWSREFGLNAPNSVKVSGLLFVPPESLVMVGSTYTPGRRLDGNREDKGADWDGFVTIIDSTTGAQLRSQRLSSVPNRDDKVINVCKSDNSTSEIYVIGITEGSLKNRGKDQSEFSFTYQPGAYRTFIQKIDTRTMETLWVEYMEAVYNAGTDVARTPQVHGMACAVTSDGGEVYLAGTVKDGAVINPATRDATKVEAKSHGGDDIFIAQYQATDGKLNFALQIGTTQNDTLGHGVSLVTSVDGDAILLGNTEGSFMKAKSPSSSSDMFVISVARKRGRHLPVYEEVMELDTPKENKGLGKPPSPNYFNSEANRGSIESTSLEHLQTQVAPVGTDLQSDSLNNRTIPKAPKSNKTAEEQKEIHVPSTAPSFVIFASPTASPPSPETMYGYEKDVTVSRPTGENVTNGPSTALQSDKTRNQKSWGDTLHEPEQTELPASIPSEGPSYSSKNETINDDEDRSESPSSTFETREPSYAPKQTNVNIPTSMPSPESPRNIESGQVYYEAPIQSPTEMPPYTDESWPHLRSRVPSVNYKPPHVHGMPVQTDEGDKRSINKGRLAAIISSIVTANIVLFFVALVLLFHCLRRKNSQNFRVLPGPYLDEGSKVRFHDDGEEDWLVLGKCKAASDSNSDIGSAHNPVVIEDLGYAFNERSWPSRSMLISSGDVPIEACQAWPPLLRLDTESDESTSYQLSDIWNHRRSTISAVGVPEMGAGDTRCSLDTID